MHAALMGLLGLVFLPIPATAAEVVWLNPPSNEQRSTVATAAHAEGPPLAPLDLRAAASRWTEADERALRDLTAALADARNYETLLDGELLILRDLQPPLERVGALRDAADRNILYTAFLYQGFAVNRYFAQSLESDFMAAPHRTQVVGQVVEKAWLNAAALEPERRATAYEIGEAPQRTAYEERRVGLASQAPATLTLLDLPETARIVVDGRPTDIGPGGNVKVRPGYHLLHAEIDGRIIARWKVELAPADKEELRPAVGEALWTAFLASLVPSPADEAEPVPLPPPIVALVEAMGGEVWLASTAGPVWSLTATGRRTVPPDATAPPAVPAGPRAAFRLTMGGLVGWLSSGDFYTQDADVVPRTVASVNAPTMGGWLEASFPLSRAAPAVASEGRPSARPIRLGGGVDVLVPLGVYHVALTGDRAVRPRPVPYGSIGLGPLDLAGGWLFPYHAGMGAHLTLPLARASGRTSLVLRGVGWAALPTAGRREDGSRWMGRPVFTATTGLGLAPPRSRR